MAERRGARRSTTDKEEAAKERAAALHRDGMPFQMAMAVAHGRLDLSTALETMARKQRAERLEQEHGLGRALATQVAMGQLDLELVLRRRRLAEHRTENRDRTWLEPGRRLVLGLHDRKPLTATIDKVDPYSVHVLPEKGEAEEIHKLQVQFAYDPAQWKLVKKAIRTDKAVAQLKLEPVRLPQERYGCSDKRLFNYLDTKVDISVILLGGQTIKGQVAWFSRYEFEIEARNGARVGVFRHALHRVSS